MAVSNRFDRFQVTGHAHLMNRQDGSSPRSDGILDPIRIEIISRRLNINEDWLSAAIMDAIGGGEEGMADRNDFVSRLNSDNQ